MSHNSTTTNVAHANEFIIGFCVVLLIFGAIAYVGGVAMRGMIRGPGLGEPTDDNATDFSSATALLGARTQAPGQPSVEMSSFP